MNSRIINKIFSLLLALSCLAIPTNTTKKINAETVEKIKVGYYINDNFQEVNDNSSKSGYGFEYLQKVAYYTGWKYEYVYGNWTDLLQGLKDGVIDVMGGVSITPDRSDILFPNIEMGFDNYYIFKKSDNKQLTSSIDTLKDAHFGVIKNSTMYDCLTSWANSNSLDINITTYSDHNDMITGFDNNEVDVISSTDITIPKDSNYAPLLKIGKSPYYLAVGKGKQQLLSILNNALDQINELEPYFVSNLQYKYFGESSIASSFSNEELDWLENHKNIVIGYYDNYLPFCSKVNGVETGLLTDVINKIVQELSLSSKISYINYSSYDDMIEELGKKQIDIAFPVNEDLHYAEEKNIYLSNPVITSYMQLVYLGNYSIDVTKSIGVYSKNTMQISYTKMMYPDANLIYFNSIEECLSAVKNKKIGSTIINSTRSNLLINSREYQVLNTIPLSKTDSSCFGVGEGNSTLLKILNRGLRVIGSEFGNNASLKYISNNYSAIDFLSDNAIFISILLIVIIIVIILVSVIISRKMKNKNKQLQVTSGRLKTQFEIVNGLSKEFLNVFLLNLSTRKVKIIKLDGYATEGFSNRSLEYDYHSMIEKYIKERVIFEDRETLLQSLNIDNVIKELERNPEYIGTYRISIHDEIHYYQFKFITLKTTNEIILGFQNIDAFVKEEKEKQDKLLAHTNVIEGLASDYFSVLLIDCDSNTVTSYYSTGKYGKILDSFFTSDSMAWDDLLAKYTEKYVSNADKKKFSTLLSLKNIKDESSVKVLNYQVNTSTGEMTVLQVRVSYVLQPDGKRFAIVGTKNITNIIKEDQLQKEKLKDALDTAERANNAKTIFLNNMSHDIRTPMNAIIGFTNLASSHLEDQKATKEYLNKISISSQHLLNLINDVLDMAKIESGNVTLKEKSVSLPKIIHDIRTINYSTISEKQQELSISQINVRHENVFTDELRLNQVLLNVVSNAMKYTPNKGKISISLEECDSDNPDYANFIYRIKDTGKGMSKEFMEHLFESFAQEHDSTISGIQGTGLGMSITKKLVTMMNGTIEVQSEINKGTEFKITIPYKIDHTLDIKVPDNIKGYHILIVDDNEASCENISNLLNQYELNAEWTTSGEKAVDIALERSKQGKPFDAYIIDWLMPKMDGIQLIKKGIEKIGKSKLPAIILSAYDYSEIENKAENLGVKAFCSKPLFVTEILDILSSPQDIVPKAKVNDNIITFHQELILLVEDNKLNQEIAESILKSLNLRVDIVSNGLEAVQKISSQKAGTYSAVLMDIQMPKMNGYDATIAIRNLKYKAKANIPIIAMTANAFEDDKKHAFDVGMNDHLSKPISVSKISESISKFIK